MNSWHRPNSHSLVRALSCALCLTTLVLLLGCATTAGPAGPDQLAGRSFLSTRVTDNGEPRDLVATTRIRLNFADAHLTAVAGCNTLGSSYAVADGTLVVGEPSMTEMSCSQELADQDEWLARLLQARPTVAIQGDELTLTDRTTRVQLLDRKVADPDRPLVGTRWRVESLISGEAVSSIPGEATATLMFQDDGTVNVNTGCNTGRGKYVASAGTMTISELALTMMACPDGRGDLERAVLAVLKAPEVTVRVEAASLTLMAGDKGLGLRAE